MYTPKDLFPRAAAPLARGADVVALHLVAAGRAAGHVDPAAAVSRNHVAGTGRRAPPMVLAGALLSMIP